jgi:predicted DNA-binding transcriptional regulator YafY
MGAKNAYETIARVVQAFAESRTWKQAELARRVEVTSSRISKILQELATAGMPLEREEEPPQVYWSVPTHWFPGGVVFSEEDWPILVHVIARISDERRRKRLLGRLVEGRVGRGVEIGALDRLERAVAATPLSDQEHALILQVEGALMAGRPLRIYYFSTSGGTLEWRLITPVRVQTEPRARIAAVCHRSNSLKWFRVDNVQRAEVASQESPAQFDAEAVEHFVSTSVDGFNDGTKDLYAFVVRLPEGYWVKRNLLSGMKVDENAESKESFRVIAQGAALVVARFVCGLGGAATAEGDPLKALVRKIAEETLSSNASTGTQY